MAQVKTYLLPPTALIPNSPHPLIHYPSFFSKQSIADQKADIFELFEKHGWGTQWIYRYGPTQASHYHSTAHECMVVLSGNATIRFGVADTSDDLEESTHGAGKEEGGVQVEAHAGDVFVLPAGTAHKTFQTSPGASFQLLTPGRGHGVEADDVRRALANIELSGFTMMGAYPKGSVWDFAVGGDSSGNYDRVWSVALPENDPVLGRSHEGLRGLWQEPKGRL